MTKPLIGITAYDYFRPGTDWRYDISYGRNAAAIEEAGGLPVLIPSRVSKETLRAIYDRLDGVLLPGGGDVNPDRYQHEKHETSSYISDERDAMEIQMAQWAVADDMPVLGICRGIQVMNVALGGTLIQDIPSQVETEYRHDIVRNGEEPRDTILHDVTIDSASRLANIIGDTTLSVNSLHHQSLQAVAPGLTVTAHAPDGLIEAVEMRDKHFVLAVQWHPEDLNDDGNSNKHLFTAFIEAARERMKVR